MELPSSLIDQIVNKIPSEERRELIVTRQLKLAVAEQIRKLEIKMRVGKLGKGDSQETRAAIILEYIVRQKTRHRFSLEALSAALSIKKNTLQALHTKVGNHLTLSSQGQAPSALKRTHPTSSASVARKKTKSSNFEETGDASSHSIIPELAIVLGPLVHDSHGFARRAQQLLLDISNLLETKQYSNHHTRRGLREDLERNRTVYEAVCFYLVAKEAIVFQNAKQQVEDEVVLDMQHVITASKVSEKAFKDILPTVEDLAAKLSQQKDKRPTPPRQKGKKSSSRKGKVQESEEKDHAVIDGLDDRDTREMKDESFSYSPVFVKWKETVLKTAQEDAAEALSTEINVPIDEISSDQALERAANDILREHGLLSTT